MICLREWQSVKSLSEIYLNKSKIIAFGLRRTFDLNVTHPSACFVIV